MLNDIREEKIRKLNNFIEAGIDPYPSGPFKKQDSKKVLEKNGFTLLGIAKDYYFDRGKFIDMTLYRKVFTK